MPLILALAPLVATIKVLTFHHVALSETKAMPRVCVLFRQTSDSSDDKECVNSVLTQVLKVATWIVLSLLSLY